MTKDEGRAFYILHSVDWLLEVATGLVGMPAFHDTRIAFRKEFNEFKGCFGIIENAPLERIEKGA